MNIILKDFGERVADDIKPSDIDAWLSDHKCAPATKNRYKNVFGRTFKNALADGKVTSNPARLVEQRPESNGRIQFLSDKEETILHEAIKRRCPDHMEEFDIALNTGMRKSEQYTTEWPQISFNRKRVKLEGTKNGSDREIPMNKTCMSAYDALCRRRRNQQLHLTLPSAHVHQSSGYERRGPPDRAGIGWSQDDLHDRPVCPCRTRTQSGRGRKAGFCSCLSADLWKMPNWLDDLELSRSVGSHFSAVESVIQPNVQDGLNGRIASDQT